MKVITSKLCVICDVEFSKPVYCSRADWEIRRFCSPACKAESQKGKPALNKGLKQGFSSAVLLPCRICGNPTKYKGGENSPVFGMVHCGNQVCAVASREMKNLAISEKAKQQYANGNRQKRNYWTGVSRISKEEKLLAPWFISMGWTPQYKILTGVHTNKLPRMFHLDFALPETRLYIEIDGSVHRLHKERDARRDQMLTDLLWRGLRVSAPQIASDIELVKRNILNWINLQQVS